ncbi:oxidoreductase [Desulfomarina profundi]|uniref:Oxidoreductase n=1 Tax=Desulfomarina profundi TaxID=2772557 RepID=A0A8D5FG38_9BACT|nr:Gfo/Idh/MocA family oxidoreductase [Desulfomarina profundi]BCL61017.1 oxidoreductase [Desulfomarina profundi]
MLNIAVIGCGYWGPNLIRNFMQAPDWQLVWVCDADEIKLNSVMTAYPGVKKTLRFQEILDDKSVDAVAVATPVSTHYELASQCVSKGKHVLIEKPICQTAEQGEKLVRLAEQHAVQLMCDHTFCYTGAVRKIKEYIESGELGQILYYDSVRVNLGLFQSDVNVIWDLAVHDLAIVDFLFSCRPSRVSARGVAHTDSSLENIAYVTLEYENSFIANFHVNWLSPVKIRKTLIGGSRKMIEWNDLVPAEKVRIYDKGITLSAEDKKQKSKLLISYRSGDILAPCIDQTEALTVMVKEFAQCIHENRPPLTDGKAALRVLKILEVAQQSLVCGGSTISMSW